MADVMPDEAGPVLPDYLAEGLKVVFVGTAASNVSAVRGHYYASPRNAFWTLLHAAGFTDRVLEPAEDGLVLRYGLGLTDVLKGYAAGDDLELPRGRFQVEAAALEEKLRRYAPRFVCFTSKNAFRAHYGHKPPAYGLQPETIGSSAVFVAPSPSARVAARRVMEGKTRLLWYRELASLVG